MLKYDGTMSTLYTRTTEITICIETKSVKYFWNSFYRAFLFKGNLHSRKKVIKAMKEHVSL